MFGLLQVMENAHTLHLGMMDASIMIGLLFGFEANGGVVDYGFDMWVVGLCAGLPTPQNLHCPSINQASVGGK